MKRITNSSSSLTVRVSSEPRDGIAKLDVSSIIEQPLSFSNVLCAKRIHRDVSFNTEGGISDSLSGSITSQVAPNGIVYDRGPVEVFTHNDVPLPMFPRRTGSFPRRGIPVTDTRERVRVVRGQIFLARDRQTHTRHRIETESRRERERRSKRGKSERRKRDGRHATALRVDHKRLSQWDITQRNMYPDDTPACFVTYKTRRRVRHSPTLAGTADRRRPRTRHG